jgi:hypothetical protein
VEAPPPAMATRLQGGGTVGTVTLRTLVSMIRDRAATTVERDVAAVETWRVGDRSSSKEEAKK